jgi:Cell wall-active antibiotics response 4TMS YvqF
MTYPSYPPNGTSAGQARPIAQPLDDPRERAIRLLTDAYAYDVITEFEFERRLSQLSLTATPAKIESLVADLQQPPSVIRNPVPGYAPIQGEGRIVGFMSETRRKGPWRLPQRLLVRAIMSDMKIDLRYAAIPAGCSIEVSAIMANVQLIVPPGLIVNFNINPILGSARSDADDGSHAGRQSHVDVHGSAIMAEVRVRVRQLGR